MGAAGPAVLALVVTIVCTQSDGQISTSNEQATWDYIMEDMLWPGPEKGCETVLGDGGRELQLGCALPTGHVTVTTDRSGSYLKIKCEPEIDGAGNVNCKELHENAAKELWNHTGEALAQHFGKTRVLDWLGIKACVLSEPLQCLLGLVAASDVHTVVLEEVPTPLQPEHVQNLTSLTHLRMLDVDGNTTRLPYEALAMLPALERLDVHGGSLQLEEGGAGWRPLKQLQMLELVLGRLSSVPARAFFSLSQLRNLSLWSNKIETLDENAFEDMSQLEILSLNSNELKVLPPRLLYPVTRLRRLHLYGNQISALPQLQHLTSLEEVWVDNKKMATLQLHNGTFAGLPALRVLKLDLCRLEAVPPQLMLGSHAIRELSLTRNRLKDLPPGLLADQNSLRVLDLSHNRLRTLPPLLLASTRELEDLNLSTNDIESLPNGIFLSLAAVKKLDLSDNKLNELHSRVFEGLTSIKELDLSNNSLTMTKDADVEGRMRSPLAELKSLKTIILTHNAVHRFMDDWRDLHHLENLNLSHNVIQELSDVDLQLLSEATVNLQHNNISRVQQLPAAMLKAGEENLSRARFLLDENPFHCDCHMYHFLVGLRMPKVAQLFDVSNARCVSPPALSGKLLKDVSPAALFCPLPAPKCPANCTCVLRPATYDLELDCAELPRSLPLAKDFGARGVRLRLRSPLASVASLPGDVRLVDLSGLALKFPPTATYSVSNLTVNLSGNSLTGAPHALLEANCKVMLAGNPLACDCEHQESLARLQQHWNLVVDGDALRCGDGEWVKGKDAGALCAGRNALALGIGSGLAVALLVLIMFRYRTEILLFLGRFELFDFLLPKRDAGMLEKKYDAFVSFSHHDDEYVRKVLVPALEGGRRPLRLCLHYRDWEVGDLIPEQIDRSVRESWRTIVVLSEDFVKSMWGRHEFRAAHGMERVIVLVLGDALRAMEADKELRAYKKTHTCIMASHPLVWDRIRDAVYRSKSAAIATPKLVVEKGSVAAAEKDTKGVGRLNVKLHNGQLVNEAALPVATKPKGSPPTYCNLAYLSTD